MNIIFSVNNGYMNPLKALLCSLLNNEPSTHFNIYILQTEQLLKNHIKDLESILGEHGKISIIDVPIIECNTRFSSASLSRIIAPFFLPDTAHKALYLDADILIRKPLHSLYNMELTQKSICAVPDFACDTEDSYYMQQLKLARPYHYVNSGVLLFNLDKFRTSYSFEDLFVQLKDYSPISSFIDQDFINDYFRDDIQYADTTYNHPPVWHSRTSPVIVHYLGEKKPWNTNYDLKYFFEYRKIWNSVISDLPLTKLSFLKNIFTKLTNLLFRKNS